MTTTKTADALARAIADEAGDLMRVAADLGVAAADDDVPVRTRAEALLELCDARERLEELHDRLTGAAVFFGPHGAA